MNDIEKDRHFSGVFNICGEELQGELIYNKSNGVILVNVAKAITIEDLVGKHYQNVDIIVGKINTGETVILFNNKCTKNLTKFLQNQRICFIADYLVWSNDTFESNKYSRYICVLDNALDWSGLSSIDFHEPHVIKYKNSTEKKSYSWFGVNVTFSSAVQFKSAEKGDASINIVEHLVLQIESSHKESIPFFIDIRKKILAFISFSIKNNVNLERQYLENDDEVYTIEDHKECYKYSLWTSEFYLPIYKNFQYEFNCKLDQLSNSEDVDNKLCALSPIFNLYLSLFKYKDMPKEMIFLNVVQALETLHSRFFYENNKNKFIESVENRFKNENNYEEICKMLLPEYQKNTSHIILYSRLNDLLIGKNDGLFIDYYLQELDFAQQVVDTRNYYTHYDKSKEAKALKDDELIKAVNVLRLLLEYHICSLLQIDNTVMIKNNLSRIK